MRLQQRRRVVQEQPGRAHLGQLLRRLEQRLVTAAAVEQAGLELLARADDRLGGFAEVVDVVERVVEPEHVDAALRGGGDEAAGEIAPDGPGADEKAAAERERERGRGSRLQRSDALPGALDAPPNGVVEDAAA